MMKKMCQMVVLFLGAVIFFSVLAGTAHKKSTHNVLTEQNPVYTLKLKSNPTTGYSWFLISYDYHILTLSKHQYEPPKDKKRMGAPGHEIWEFVATPLALEAPQVTTIKMIYARLWELKAGKLNSQHVKTFHVVTKS